MAEKSKNINPHKEPTKTENRKHKETECNTDANKDTMSKVQLNGEWQTADSNEKIISTRVYGKQSPEQANNDSKGAPSGGLHGQSSSWLWQWY